MPDEKETIEASKITVGDLKAADIEAGHIAIGIINMETGKQGVRHLYSDRYRERWPQDQYPEKYEEDGPVE
jgi:hypothetical protein